MRYEERVPLNGQLGASKSRILALQEEPYRIIVASPLPS